MTQHQTVILKSTLRTKLRSSASVHVAWGLNLHETVSPASFTPVLCEYDLPMYALILGDGYEILSERRVLEDVLSIE